MRSEVGEHRTRTGEENPLESTPSSRLALLHTLEPKYYITFLSMSAYQTVQFAVQPRVVVALRRCLLTLLTYFTVCLSSRLIKHVSSSSSCDARSNAYRLADAPASGIEAD